MTSLPVISFPVAFLMLNLCNFPLSWARWRGFTNFSKFYEGDEAETAGTATTCVCIVYVKVVGKLVIVLELVQNGRKFCGSHKENNFHSRSVFVQLASAIVDARRERSYEALDDKNLEVVRKKLDEVKEGAGAVCVSVKKETAELASFGAPIPAVSVNCLRNLYSLCEDNTKKHDVVEAALQVLDQKKLEEENLDHVQATVFSHILGVLHQPSILENDTVGTCSV
ncbi:uncharacterized protein LOC135394391 isoform X2 [Ornithodoros turicata]|uniref:uncharacterized protein LOC135394391 isoform X2 n=1 Tax=Ornithodoros turicata TaxID=34597 RepID=UPI003138CC1C